MFLQLTPPPATESTATAFNALNLASPSASTSSHSTLSSDATKVKSIIFPKPSSSFSPLNPCSMMIFEPDSPNPAMRSTEAIIAWS